MGIARMLLLTWGACCLAGCGQAEPAASPGQGDAQHGGLTDAQLARQSRREQRARERRLLKLENQALSELRQLRENSLGSGGVPETAHKDELLVFGGASHEVFLGCLCDERHSDSVFNMLGEHGSHASPASIRNKFAPYGSNHDDTSACNAAATRPPVVVASDGKSLGLLSTNSSLKKTITAPSVASWLARMCGE